MAERAELADKVAGLQASVYKANEKLDGFKLLMNWNQEEMEQWALAQRQKEEDNTALDKYKKQDAAKVGGVRRRVWQMPSQQFFFRTFECPRLSLFIITTPVRE